MFTRQICIKTPTGMLCSASPIVECGKAQPSAASDPYAHLAETTGSKDDPKVFLAEVTKIVESRKGILAGKGDGVLKAIKLLLHPEVKADKPFVMTGIAL